MTAIAAVSTAAPTTVRAAGAGQGALSADFETFLRMLTTQLKNQDPLNPMQSTEFAVQLATFSGVEQAVRTNQLLESMMSQSALGELAGLVGLAARAPGALAFDGNGVELSLPAVEGAETARLIVRDALGQVVDSTEVPVAGGSHVWRGLGADGTALPTGRYSFEVAGYRDGQVATTLPAEGFAEVREARRDGDATVLVLADGRTVPLATVSALRAPDG